MLEERVGLWDNQTGHRWLIVVARLAEQSQLVVWSFCWWGCRGWHVVVRSWFEQMLLGGFGLSDVASMLVDDELLLGLMVVMAVWVCLVGGGCFLRRCVVSVGEMAQSNWAWSCAVFAGSGVGTATRPARSMSSMAVGSQGFGLAIMLVAWKDWIWWR